MSLFLLPLILHPLTAHSAPKFIRKLLSRQGCQIIRGNLRKRERRYYIFIDNFYLNCPNSKIVSFFQGNALIRERVKISNHSSTFDHFFDRFKYDCHRLWPYFHHIFITLSCDSDTISIIF